MSDNQYRTITVKPDTKEEFNRVKRSGLSQDAFVTDLLECWRENND